MHTLCADVRCHCAFFHDLSCLTLSPRLVSHLDTALPPQVQLLRWEGPRGGGQPEVHDMKLGERGAWSLQVPPAWEGSYYKYRYGWVWAFVWREGRSMLPVLFGNAEVDQV